jgi:2-methylcitrate synthase/citrate synthase II
MTGQATPIYKGLEGIAISESTISDVGGNTGTLEYRGYHIHDLALSATYEEVVYLLWYSKLPDKAELAAFKKKLYSYRALPDELITILKALPKSSTPISVLRTAVSALGLFDPKADDNSPDTNLEKTYRLTASMGTLVAAWERIRQGEEPVPQREDLGMASNFLYMLTGKEADATSVHAINSTLIMLADHGMNASTFSARVTTSTLSDIYSAITSAIGTLKGASHGGANEKAMRQFIEIGSPDNVESWFEKIMATGGRIMGIGHRAYKTGDPRMLILKDQARDLAESTGNHTWYEIATRLEALAMNNPFFIKRKLHPNVDYYSAITLYQSGIPIDQFTPLFAVSRIAGWCAHILEQWQDNRLIRPDIIYVGAHDQKYVPLDER